MHEHELWLTALLNQYLGAPANAVLNLLGLPAEDAAKPWTNYNAMLLLVAAIIVVAAALIRSTMSVEKPGKIQQAFELIYEGLGGLAHDIVGHGSARHMAWFSTIFLTILASNLLGLIPTLESPTMFASVPAGLAICSFLYYNGQGVKAQGVLGHLKHFCGPMWWLAWFMFPLEVISHCIRPVSLTIRLYANMFAGEQVTVGFLALAPLLVPVVFMGLHLFVSMLQAFIFTILSMAYVGEAVAHEDH